MNIEEVREALIEWENLSADEKNRIEYEARLRELRDQLSNLQGYHRKDKEEGKMEAIKQIAVEMLKEGNDVEFIVKVTKLSIDEIEALKKNL